MISKHDAIFATHPQVAVVRDDIAYDKDNNVVEYSETIVQSYIDANEYTFKRQAEYPPFTDYLDGVVKGDQAQIDAYIAACQAVKAKYPK
jgi:hypothetical protein